MKKKEIYIIMTSYFPNGTFFIFSTFYNFATLTNWFS